MSWKYSSSADGAPPSWARRRFSRSTAKRKCRCTDGRTMKGGRFVAGGSCWKSPKSIKCTGPSSSGALRRSHFLKVLAVLSKVAMPCQNSSSIIETSSSSRAPSCRSTCTRSSSMREKSLLLLNSVSKSNSVWIVVAAMSVPGTSMLAAAMPVGAAALNFL
eukprot:11270237-Karenia_brevis.AAC.1